MTGRVIRPFERADAPASAAILNEIIAQVGMTAYEEPLDPDRLGDTLCDGPQTRCAHVALSGGRLAGFQALNRHPDLPADCGDMASFVCLRQIGAGIGRALFAVTCARAQMLGLTAVIACIRADNAVGLGYLLPGDGVYGKRPPARRAACLRQASGQDRDAVRPARITGGASPP